MEALYKLKDMLCDELEEYGRKGELTAGSLDIVDKLSHALKSLTTVIAMEESDGGYSGRPYGNDGMMPPYRGNSYARGRMNAKRDSRGRYSRDDYGRDGYSGAVEDMKDQLNDLMADAPNEQIRQEIQRLMSKIDKM